MRTVVWLAVAATAVAMAAVAAPGRPDKDPPIAELKVTSLKDATDAFVRAVAEKVGPKAELTYRVNTFGKQCRNGTKPADDIYRGLKKKVTSIDWSDDKPKLADGEQFAIEIATAKGDTFRFALALEQRRDLTNPARKLFVIKCSSTTLADTYEVRDQKEVGEIMEVNTAYDSKAGMIMIQAAPPEAEKPTPKKLSQIDVPNFGTIEIRKWVTAPNGKEQLDKRPLPFTPVAVELVAGVKGWRYACPDLNADSTFEVVLFNGQPNAWAIDVMLDGRSSTEMAGRFKGAKYIIPAKGKDRDPDEWTIKGWLKEPKGETGADGKQAFDYTEFKVINVPDADPKLKELPAADRSTIRVTWYGAWPEGTERPRDLPNPQSSGTDIVGGGNHGTMDLKVVKYDMDKKPSGSVVIEFGGRANKK